MFILWKLWCFRAFSCPFCCAPLPAESGWQKEVEAADLSHAGFFSIYYVNGNFSPTQTGRMWLSISLEWEFTPYCWKSLKMQTGLPDSLHVPVGHISAKTTWASCVGSCSTVGHWIHPFRWKISCTVKWFSHILFVCFLAWCPQFLPAPSLVHHQGSADGSG